MDYEPCVCFSWKKVRLSSIEKEPGAFAPGSCWWIDFARSDDSTEVEPDDCADGACPSLPTDLSCISHLSLPQHLLVLLSATPIEIEYLEGLLESLESNFLPCLEDDHLLGCGTHVEEVVTEDTL